MWLHQNVIDLVFGIALNATGSCTVALNEMRKRSSLREAGHLGLISNPAQAFDLPRQFPNATNGAQRLGSIRNA